VDEGVHLVHFHNAVGALVFLLCSSSSVKRWCGQGYLNVNEFDAVIGVKCAEFVRGRIPDKWSLCSMELPLTSSRE